MACHYDIFETFIYNCVNSILNLVKGIDDLNIRHHWYEEILDVKCALE